jgi:hypothetical protein
MPLLTALGSAGIGLVWGWRIARSGGQEGRPRLGGAAARVASLILLAGQVHLVAGDGAAVVFFGAIILAFALRLGWHRALRQRPRGAA